jgi:hypothetical protein
MALSKNSEKMEFFKVIPPLKVLFPSEKWTVHRKRNLNLTEVTLSKVNILTVHIVQF